MVIFRDLESEAHRRIEKMRIAKLAIDPFSEYAELLDRYFFESGIRVECIVCEGSTMTLPVPDYGNMCTDCISDLLGVRT